MTKTTLADIVGTCERAAFRMGLEAREMAGEPAGDTVDVRRPVIRHAEKLIALGQFMGLHTPAAPYSGDEPCINCVNEAAPTFTEATDLKFYRDGKQI